MAKYKAFGGGTPAAPPAAPTAQTTAKPLAKEEEGTTRSDATVSSTRREQRTGDPFFSSYVGSTNTKSTLLGQ